MKNQTITKTINKINSDTEKTSLGFKRFMNLPNKQRKNLQLSYYLNTGSTDWHSSIVELFEGMTNKEFINWLRVN